MDVLRKPVAVYLMLSALAVLLHFWISPFYPDSWDTGVMWDIIDVLMAVGIVATMGYTFAHKRGVDSDAGTLAQVCAYTVFYAAAVLAVLFFWNWFDDVASGGDQSDTRFIFWPIINTMYIVVVGTVGCHLWRK